MTGVRLTSPRLAINFLGNYDNPGYFNRFCKKNNLDYLNQEVFLVLAINSKGWFLKSKLVSLGTLTATLITPKECFRFALNTPGCSSIILIHNHPSGDCEPSKEDQSLTRRMRKAGEEMVIPIADHIIIGDKESYSFRVKEMWDSEFGDNK